MSFLELEFPTFSFKPESEGHNLNSMTTAFASGLHY